MPTFIGTPPDDVINGSVDPDDIYGDAGDDVLIDDEATTGSDTFYGGDGADTIHAAAGDTVFGGAGGTDDDILDLTDSVVLPGGALNVVITGADSNANGFDGFVEYYDRSNVLQDTLHFAEIENIIPCFTPGTLIKTIRGEVPVERLSVGDRVLTMDNGYQPLLWVGSQKLTRERLDRQENLRPVRIAQGALGNGRPARDMLLSPQHRMLVNSAQAELWFGSQEVLVAARHLTVLDGIDVVEADGVEYFQIMCRAHEVICADGAWTESFQPNDMTLDGEDSEIREELAAIFPDLELDAIKNNYTSARYALKKYEAATLFS